MMSALWPSLGRFLVRHAVDLDLAIDHHARHHAGARRRIGPEIFLEYLVEGLEVARIVEPDTAAHHMLGGVPGFLQNGQHVLDGPVRLCDDAIADDLSVYHRHLAGHVKPAIGCYGLRKRQVLPAGAGAAGRAVSLNAHACSSCSVYGSSC